MSQLSSHSINDTSQNADSLRKRVGKACDRCRLKKSKCDGTNPCSRCKVDNAICVFGERKKSHDKVYPKGYVEMLEQQQNQLVAGLQDTYRRLLAVNSWPGMALDEKEGHPLTHDILTALNIIQFKGDVDSNTFEEDPSRLQSRLIAHGAPYINRRASMSSESDQSTSQSQKRPRSRVDSPMSPPALKSFRSSFDQDHGSSPPLPASPVTHTHTLKPRTTRKLSALQTESPMGDHGHGMEDDSLMPAWSWQDLPPEGVPSHEPQFTFPTNQQTGFNLLDSWPNMMSNQRYDPTFMGTYPPGLGQTFDYGNVPQQMPRDAHDLDINTYLPIAT